MKKKRTFNWLISVAKISVCWLLTSADDSNGAAINQIVSTILLVVKFVVNENFCQRPTGMWQLSHVLEFELNWPFRTWSTSKQGNPMSNHQANNRAVGLWRDSPFETKKKKGSKYIESQPVLMSSVVCIFGGERRSLGEKPQANTNKNYTSLDPNHTAVRLASI